MNEHERIAELAKRRGFFFPSAGAYGGVAGFYTYGPAGAALKRELEDAWRDRFAVREGYVEIHSPTVLPEAVFEASGHLDTFDDMLVECAECGESHRADHLVEDAAGIEDAEAMAPEAVAERIADHDVACPTCGASLAGREVEPFNLMFETTIGPGSSSPGYLRPETAQGIFVEFPRLSEYARGQLPFGVAQVGPAYRNEISPRKGLIRLRELNQAELEVFVHPEDDDAPIDRVADVSLPLYAASAQHAADGGVAVSTVREAIDADVVTNPWIAYYLGVAREWYDRMGVDLDRFRFRQHLPGERAHYAVDCWDAEAEIGGDWIELAGIASRGAYDLGKHDEHSDDDFTLFEQYDEPQTIERPSVDPDMSYLGPEYGSAAGGVADALSALAAENPSAFDGDEVTVAVDGDEVTVPVERTGFAIEEETVQGEHFVPHVIEPSFGVDRLVYTVVSHGLDADVVDGEERTVLRLPPTVAPTFVGVFPLMDRDGLGKHARRVADRLRDAGLSVTYDDSGSIGRRYRRQDEVGTPYCVTVDYDTLEDDTVTIRDRDSASQRRVQIDDLPGVLVSLRTRDRSFEEIGVEAAT